MNIKIIFMEFIQLWIITLKQTYVLMAATESFYYFPQFTSRVLAVAYWIYSGI